MVYQYIFDMKGSKVSTAPPKRCDYWCNTPIGFFGEQALWPVYRFLFDFCATKRCCHEGIAGKDTERGQGVAGKRS